MLPLFQYLIITTFVYALCFPVVDFRTNFVLTVRNRGIWKWKRETQAFSSVQYKPYASKWSTLMKSLNLNITSFAKNLFLLQHICEYYTHVHLDLVKKFDVTKLTHIGVLSCILSHEQQRVFLLFIHSKLNQHHSVAR